MLLYFRGTEWLIPAIAINVVLGLIIYWGNKRMFLVPYRKDQNTTNDGWQKFQYNSTRKRAAHFKPVLGHRKNGKEEQDW